MHAKLIKTIDRSALQAVLEAHGKFVRREPNGRRASLAYHDLTNLALEGVELREADLTGARLSGALLRAAQLDGAILFGADLRDADLRDASLTRADLRGVCLRGANLTNADLMGCDFREGRAAVQNRKDGFQILTHEKKAGELSYAILAGANLEGAQMGELAAIAADFRDAKLTGAVLSGAKLK